MTDDIDLDEILALIGETESASSTFENEEQSVHQKPEEEINKTRRHNGHEKVCTVSIKQNNGTYEESKKSKPNYVDWKISLPFFIAVLTLMIVSFIIPLRPEKSIRERRSLAVFPVFSVESLVNGNYFEGISDWFSDTFPGREGWIDINDKISSLHGIKKVAFNFSNTPTSADEHEESEQEIQGSSDDIQSLEDAHTQPVEVMPAEDYSEEELLEITSDEDIIEWGGLQNNEAAEVILGNIIQIDDSCYNYFTFSEEYSQVHASIANDIGNILEDNNVRFFDMLVPDSLGILYTPEFVEKLGCANYEQALDYVYGLENDNVTTVNLYDTLVSHNDEYIYFRTDHHWTALGAYYAYTEWCNTAGYEPVSLDAYTEIDMGTYHGSFYAKAPDSSKLTDDNLIGYVPPGNLTTVVDSGEGKFVADAVRDMSNAQVTYKYQAFICGDNPLTVITNDDIPDAPNCLIIQDSFGNPFSVYLAQHYHKVYIVDYREGYLTFSRFVKSYDISDVIIEEYLGFIQGSDTNYLFRQMAK